MNENITVCVCVCARARVCLRVSVSEHAYLAGFVYLCVRVSPGVFNWLTDKSVSLCWPCSSVLPR